MRGSLSLEDGQSPRKTIVLLLSENISELLMKALRKGG